MANLTITKNTVARVHKYATRYLRVNTTVKRTVLWGLIEEDNVMTNTSLQLIANTKKECYVYQPGDVCNVLDDRYDLLWLRQINLEEISVSPTLHGKIQVCYKGEPIIRMRGVELIRTEDGCFSLDHWLAAAA